MMMRKGENMWDDFSDFELAQLAGEYGLEDNLVFNGSLQLSNREEVESLLTEYEMGKAFIEREYI
jgi:hypothetical protein